MRAIPWLAVAVLVVLGLAFTVSVTVDAGAVAQSNLQARGWGLIFPIIGFAALLGVFVAARARRDGLPFALTILFFVASYLTLGVMLWPYMIPYSVTVANAAAPDETLEFFLFGGARCTAQSSSFIRSLFTGCSAERLIKTLRVGTPLRLIHRRRTVRKHEDSLRWHHAVDGVQKIAVAAGFTMVAWPTKPVTAKVIVLGLNRATAEQ